MESYTCVNNANPAFVDDLYQQFLDNPDSIDQSWQDFFKGYDFANNGEPSKKTFLTDKEVNVIKLIHGYRTRGHLIAKTNPVRQRRRHKSDLELSYFDLSEKDFNTEFESAADIKLGGKAPLKTIIDRLEKTYCGSIGAEFMYCRNEKLRQFLYQEMESCSNQPKYEAKEQIEIVQKLGQAVLFEQFLQTKYVGKKRFSLEGLEVLVPALNHIIQLAAKDGVKECVLGMSHRGRLNVLVNVFQKSYEEVFSEFEENVVMDLKNASGDVKYHLGRSADVVTEDGHPIHLSLVPNPSHLEVVSPVLQGIVNAKKNDRFDKKSSAILPLVIHGDAAIAGQGVNYEVANFSEVDGYENGGTIHIVLNNQVGFTTNYKESRTAVYCTDLAKVTESPVFHVNADDPEAIIHVMTLALKIRQTFNCDVYIDILGYRKYGHNEGDEPRFTQPLLYKTIAKHKNVYQKYLDKLVTSNTLSKEEESKYVKEIKQTLQEKLDLAKKNNKKTKPDMFESTWKNFRLATDKDFDESPKTGVSPTQLNKIAKAIVNTPKDFNLFSKMKKILDARKALYFDQKKVDWALAEALAYGSLLAEGHPIRISGQDSQRGTFSHRHAVIKDVENESQFVPLNNINKSQEDINIYNSTLSEYGVLAFEYGYSLASPRTLVIWEAQFGDFSNGAQIVMDQFVSSSETKWQRVSGLVQLLPHGYEGQGPEHSSARPERYLQLCAENNMYVCNITTPANFFHVLRRQLKTEYRKPLIVMSPKSLLRHPDVLSPISDLSDNKFQEVIDDTTADAKKVTSVLLCTGKVYYDLIAKRTEKDSHCAIVRIEQLYPWPEKQINALVKKYKKAKWTWVQEEPENMGGWTFILTRLRSLNIDVVARDAAASPATGSSKVHQKTQEQLIKTALSKK